MFEGFERVRLETEGASIDAVRRGEGPPVLLLIRGSPQTPAMWHLVAPRLAEVDRRLSDEEGGGPLLPL
jgi:haloacetate dehalogenase